MTLSDLSSLFATPADASLLVYGVYDPALVLLSVLVAVFASWMALQMAGQARQAPNGLLRVTALGTGSVALGVGVWAMHFVGMLAFSLCAPVTYDPALTVWSMLPSLGASFVALSLIARQRIAAWQLAGGALLVGLGIGAMHYAGMAAMRMSLRLTYDLPTFALSIVVAVLLAGLALWVRFGLGAAGRHVSDGARGLLAALVMGFAIASMHFMGMAAARFAGAVSPGETGGTANGSFLALMVSLVTVVLAFGASSLNGWLRYREMFRRAHENEARQRALLAAAVDGVITLNAQGEVEDFNAAAERMFGYTRAQVLGRDLATLLVSGEAAPLLQEANDLSNVLISEALGVVSRVSEMQALRADGSRLAVRASFSFRQQVEGDLFIVFVSDISAQKAVEQALQRSESQLQSVVGSIPGIAFRALVKPGWPLLYLSDVMETMVGFPAADFVGPGATRGLFELIDERDQPATMAEMSAAIVDGKPHLVEFRVRRRDGQLRWMWGNGRASFDARGRVQWLDGVILDVTERKEAELAVEHFKSLVASSGDAIYSVTVDEVVTSWNAGAEKTFGYTAQEAIGQVSAKLLDSPEPGALVARVIRGERVEQFDTQRRRKDGTLVDISATVSPIRGPEGQVVGVSVITRDITERRRMEADLRAAKEAAEKAAAARSAFLANMSHEIRTPMNAVLGFTDVLLHSELTPAQRRHLDTISSAGRSLLRLLNEVLDVAKLDRGAMQLEKADFNLLALMDGLTSTLGHEARAKGLHIEVRYPAGLAPGFHGDEMRLRQILINLLGNAVKFTAEGGVTLGVVREEVDGKPGLHFTVCDTGIGIAQERLTAIFDAFTQADASMSRRYGGTGLGTTIAKQLTELMGGRIWAESAVGKGSCFHVALPLAPAHRPLALPRPAALMRLPRLRVLAADDVPQNLELLSLLLEELGHQVVHARDGAQAVRLATREHFDVVLMDVHMPAMDGLVATRLIRQDEARRAARRVPVVALTASVQDTDCEAARQAGMDGFAAKPVELPALLAEMARVLGLDAPALEAQAQARAAASAVEELGAGRAAVQGELALNESAPAAGMDVGMDVGMDTERDAAPAAQEAASRLAAGQTGRLATMPVATEAALDYADGLRRCGGRVAVFRRLLQRFAEQYPGITQSLPAQVAAGDYAGARAEAHRIRGVAANLGLSGLHAWGTALEATLGEGAQAQGGVAGVAGVAGLAGSAGLDTSRVADLVAELPLRMAAALGAIAAATETDGPVEMTAQTNPALIHSPEPAFGGNAAGAAQDHRRPPQGQPPDSAAPGGAPGARAPAQGAQAGSVPANKLVMPEVPPRNPAAGIDPPGDVPGRLGAQGPGQAGLGVTGAAGAAPGDGANAASRPARVDMDGSAGGMPLSPAVLAEVSGLADHLARGFARGAIEEKALHRLLALLDGHVAPATQANLQRAVDDFDFTLAHGRLMALLAECAA